MCDSLLIVLRSWAQNDVCACGVWCVVCGVCVCGVCVGGVVLSVVCGVVLCAVCGVLCVRGSGKGSAKGNS